MASKTRVDGNRVTIDELVYEVARAGENQYAVNDEFGGRLGYFGIRGRVLTPEDYGIAGAPPIIQIARLWFAVHGPKDGPTQLVTKGVCLVAVHESPSDAELESARAYRAALKLQPGFKSSYLVRDPATGKALSISVWKTRAQLDAAQRAVLADGAKAPPTASFEIYPFVEEP